MKLKTKDLTTGILTIETEPADGIQALEQVLREKGYASGEQTPVKRIWKTGTGKNKVTLSIYPTKGTLQVQPVSQVAGVLSTLGLPSALAAAPAGGPAANSGASSVQGTRGAVGGAAWPTECIILKSSQTWPRLDDANLYVDAGANHDKGEVVWVGVQIIKPAGRSIRKALFTHNGQSVDPFPKVQAIPAGSTGLASAVNNLAEYVALCSGLRFIQDNPKCGIKRVFTDSKTAHSWVHARKSNSKQISKLTPKFKEIVDAADSFLRSVTLGSKRAGNFSDGTSATISDGFTFKIGTIEVEVWFRPQGDNKTYPNPAELEHWQDWNGTGEFESSLGWKE